jgi:type IV secretion system protein VirB8
MTDPKGQARRREAYYSEAASWTADIHGALRASRRIAWWIAGAACLVAGIEAMALAALAPLKTVVPYAITVDRQTGYVEAIKPLAPGALGQDQAVTQSNLVRYVLARETFDATDLRESYQSVMLWSGGGARDDYARLMQRSTPDSPLNLYGPTTTVAVTVKSVSMLSPTTALVRFDTVRREVGATAEARRSWVAAVAFRYTNTPMRQADRFLNPLGFEVTRYRRDNETTAEAVNLPPNSPTAIEAAPQ